MGPKKEKPTAQNLANNAHQPNNTHQPSNSHQQPHNSTLQKQKQSKVNNPNESAKKGLRKDEQSLLRMNFLYQAASMYKQAPQIASYFMRQLILVSQKKIIRIDKKIKKKICKNCCTFLTERRFTPKECNRLRRQGAESKGNDRQQEKIYEIRKEINCGKAVGGSRMDAEGEGVEDKKV